VAGRRGLVDGSGMGFLGGWIVDCLFFVFCAFWGGEGWRRLMGRKGGAGWWEWSGGWGREGLRVGGVCHVWFVFVMGWEMGDERLEELDRYRERERLKEHDGKIIKCCSSTHIPSKSRSGSRW